MTVIEPRMSHERYSRGVLDSLVCVFPSFLYRRNLSGCSWQGEVFFYNTSTSRVLTRRTCIWKRKQLVLYLTWLQMHPSKTIS